MKALKWISGFFLGLLVLIAVYILWVTLYYNDLSIEQYEVKYGSANLQQFNLDELNVYYTVEGKGPPLLLLHSHFFNLQMWDPWVEQLKDDYTLIRFDLPSHGFTGPDPTDDYSMARSLEIIDGLMAHLAIDTFHIVGSSLGGNIAFNYAASRDTRVESLILINSGGFRKDSDRGGRGGDLPQWADYFLYLLPKFAYRYFFSWMVVDKSLATTERIEHFMDSFRRDGNRVAEMQRIRQFKRGKSEELLAQITAPVLILWGEDNPQLPVRLADKFENGLKNAKSVEKIIFADTGHLLPIESPIRSASETKAFIEAHTKIESLTGGGD